MTFDKCIKKSGFRKIIIIGCPGAGKSFLSNQLSHLVNIKAYHLDDLFWEEDWQEKSLEEWTKIQEALVCRDEFIIDGNYIKSLAFRIEHSETIIYLNKGLLACLWGFTKRTLKNWLGKEIDLPQKVKEQTKYRVTENGFFDFCLFIVKFHLHQKKRVK